MDRGVRSFRALLPPPPPRRGQWLLDAVPSLLSPSLRPSDCDEGGGGGGIRDVSAYATPSLSGGSGGSSRGILPRVSPVPSLDAQQRVQGDAHHRLRIPATEPLSTLAAEFQYSSPILQQKLKEPLSTLAAGFQYGSPILQEKIALLDRAEVERTQKNIEQCKKTLQRLGYIEDTYEDFFTICCADESYVCFAPDDEDKWLIYDFETVKTENTWEHLLERFKDCKLQPEIEFYYKHTICCADETYVYFALNDEDTWLIYDFETVKTEDTWEHLLERFKDCKLQPEVLFFEVIK